MWNTPRSTGAIRSAQHLVLLKESGLPIAYRAAMARAGFEPAAFRGLSPDGRPVAYRAASSWGEIRTLSTTRFERVRSASCLPSRSTPGRSCTFTVLVLSEATPAIGLRGHIAASGEQGAKSGD
jgi:hypothetical protein